jgi:ribosome-interacting GTPase 1
MAKINFTHKTQNDQLRILNDYLIRRAQHKTQRGVTVDQIVNRFKHNRCYTNKAKAIYFSRLLHILENTKTEVQSETQN